MKPMFLKTKGGLVVMVNMENVASILLGDEEIRITYSHGASQTFPITDRGIIKKGLEELFFREEEPCKNSGKQ